MTKSQNKNLHIAKAEKNDEARVIVGYGEAILKLGREYRQELEAKPEKIDEICKKYEKLAGKLFKEYMNGEIS